MIQIGQDKHEELAPTSETDQPLAYNYSYATEVGQHLLNERILVCLLQHHADPVLNGLESSSTERMHAIDTTFHSSTEYQQPFRPRPLQSPTSTSSTHSLGSLRDEDAASQIQNSDQCLYRHGGQGEWVCSPQYRSSQQLYPTTVHPTMRGGSLIKHGLPLRS